MAVETIKFYLVAPWGATNLVTNPAPYRALTGYTALVGTIAFADDFSRRGPGCIKVTPTTSASGIYFSPAPVISGQVYTYGVDVKGEAGKAMRIYIADSGGAVLATKQFTATGHWQRVSVTRTENATADRRLYVVRDATTGVIPFYVDGFQFEVGGEATTFFSGDMVGFKDGDFRWNGIPHASTSTRSPDTRAGGRLVDMSDYAIVTQPMGLGMGSYKQVFTELVSGGAYYQKYFRKPRNISFMLVYTGADAGELHADREAILQYCRPEDQPMIIRYQGYDVNDSEATQPIDIVCIPQPSHQDMPDNSVIQTAVLTFTVLDGYLTGAYKEGIELNASDTLADANSFVMRDANGVWSVPNNGGTGITGAVWVLKEAPNGDIIIGFGGLNAGGVAEADYLAKLTSAGVIDDVTGAADFNNEVYTLCYDAIGNLYIGGLFTDAGDANGDYIVKWDGAALSSLGTGMGNRVLAIAIDPSTGYLYAGGVFDLAGGVANTAKIAYWNGATWVAMATGLNNDVYTLGFAPDGKLYIGGAFTNADGTDGDYLCYWNGTAFVRVGTVELSAAVRSITFDNNGRLIVGGSFTNAGGNADADYVVRWNGSEWENFGTGVNGAVYKINMVGNDLYVAGTFTEAGGLALADRVAVWRNGAWVGLGIDLFGSPTIYSVIEALGKLYVGFSTGGTAYSAGNKTVTNSGNTNIYPTIEVVGPGVLQGFRNFTTGAEIQFDGLTLQAGEIITMKLDPVNLKMTSNWRGNVLRYVNAGSDLGDFYLQPGANSITFFMPSGTTAATKAYISWTPAFWNIEGALL